MSVFTEPYPMAISSHSASQYLTDRPVLEIQQRPVLVWYDLAKQLADPLVAGLVLILLFPLFLLIGLLVKCTSDGPVFYSQERIGKGGKPFRILKFRSMYQDAEANGPVVSWAHDPRVTPLGRILRPMHLDELPQFYNVLVGDMAIIGPRPERQYFIDQLVELAPQYKYLSRVKPGITSLGQVEFGYAENLTQMTERLQYDLYYLRNVSPALDFRILLGTISIIYKRSSTVRRKAYQL